MDPYYQSTAFYQLILENIDGLLVVDRNGHIVMLNRKYAQFLGVEAKDVVGKHVRDVIEATRMDIVISSGEAEYADMPVVRGKKIICNRIPLKQDGNVLGAFALILTENIGENTVFLNTVQRLKDELDYYKNEVKLLRGAKYGLENIIGESEQIKELKRVFRKIANTHSTVLIQGETGTGKEIFAHAVHQESFRKINPFVRLNCAAIPPELLESELFGYEEGSFTGAKKKGKPGKFELANKGTIFLDEINEMPLNLQVKLLRVIQEREIDKIGAENPLPVDVKIIAATNQSLESQVQKGLFREDLFYRLNVVVLNIPPLRERKEDIPLLVENFITKLNRSLGFQVTGISGEAMELLHRYHWPGNVRELENAIERAMHLCVNSSLDVEHFYWIAQKLVGTLRAADRVGLIQNEVRTVEVEAIINALKLTKGNKARSAKILGINRVTLYKKIKKYGVSPDSYL